MKKILIVGAGFLQSFVIKKAKELGYYTYAIDRDADAVGFKYADEYATINIVDKEKAYEYAKKNNIDGVLTAATDYGVLTVAYIAERLNLKAVNYASAKLVKNKYEVRSVLHSARVDDTGIAHLISDISDIENVATKIQLPVMVKPCDGSGSRGAVKVESISDFASACKLAMQSSLRGQATVEPFIVGKEYGVESFVLDGKPYILAVMKKRMTAPPYYAELGHSVPSGLETSIEEKIKKSVERAIKALNINFGSVNMDLLLTEQGTVHIIDIGARMGGNLIGSHIIPIGTGIDYIENMIRAAVNDDASFEPKRAPEPVATAIMALTPGKITATPDMSLYADDNTFIEHHLSVGDTINEYRTNLDGCGYIVCADADVEQAEQRAQSIKASIDTAILRDEFDSIIKFAE